MPIFKLEPQIDTMDVQMSNPQVGSILICVTGRLVVCKFLVNKPAPNHINYINLFYRLIMKVNLSVLVKRLI